MQVLEAPPSLFSKAPGSLVLKPTAQALQVFIKEARANLRDYPQSCALNIRLPSWDMPPVIAIALLVSVARRDRFTFQSWINVKTPHGVQTLGNLANEGRVYVHLVTDRVERTIRAPNVVKRHAASLLKRIPVDGARWSDKQFAEACRQLDTLYPTAQKLWRACEKDGRG